MKHAVSIKGISVRKLDKIVNGLIYLLIIFSVYFIIGGMEMVFETSVFLTVGLGGFFRSAVGLIKNSLADGKIQKVEWMKIAETAGIYLTVGLLAAFGKSLGASDMELIGLGVAFLVHETWDKFAKKK